MTTYREIIFACLDLIKASSDDTYINEDHVMFLISKYRNLLIKQWYKDVRKGEIPESYYQTICMDLIQVPAISGVPCEGGTYLRSKEKIPFLLTLVTPKVYIEDYYEGDIAFVSRERMKYVGYNRWLSNIIYASIGPDNYMYFKSFNPQYLHLEKARITGIFEDPEKAAEMACDKEDNKVCDPWDTPIAMEEAMVPAIIELVVKDILGANYRPIDTQNNSADDMPKLAAGNNTKPYIANNQNN